MKIQTTIQKWGNSLAIRITGPLKTIPGFVANMPIEIGVSEEGLTIHPISLRKRKLILFKEAELLKGLTAENVHAEELVEIHQQEFGNYE
jgi:antitoxin MazE